MIPKYTKTITHEMITQLETEQTQILKEMQNHYSWSNQLKFQVINLFRKIDEGVIIH